MHSFESDKKMFYNILDFWSNRLEEEAEKNPNFLRSIHLEDLHLSQDFEMSKKIVNIQFSSLNSIKNYFILQYF